MKLIMAPFIPEKYTGEPKMKPSYSPAIAVNSLTLSSKTHFPSLAQASQPVQPAIGFLPIQKKSVLIPSSFKAFAASLSAV